MKMKLFFAGLVLLLIVGCDEASKEESLFVVQKLEDFKEVIQLLEVSGRLWSHVEVDEAEPKLQGDPLGNIYVFHLVVYRTKSNGIRIVTLNKSRPPKITGISPEIK